MTMKTAQLEISPAATAALSDAEIVRRVRAGDRLCFEVLMRRHNQQIYRVARAVVRDEHEVEEVMQQAYVNAFTHLDQFEERSKFATWLTRIALNEAFRRRRRMRRSAELTELSAGNDRDPMHAIASTQPDPERQAYGREISRLLEEATDNLPEAYRVVFMLRDIEGLSTSEAGQCLGIGEEAVKTRLHRARVMIRQAVTARVGDAVTCVFPFRAPRCDRVVSAVLLRVSKQDISS